MTVRLLLHHLRLPGLEDLVVAVREASELAFVERAQYVDQATHIRPSVNGDGRARHARSGERCGDSGINVRRTASRDAIKVVEGGEELLVEIEVVVVGAPRDAARLAGSRVEDRLLRGDAQAIDAVDDRLRAVL